LLFSDCSRIGADRGTARDPCRAPQSRVGDPVLVAPAYDREAAPAHPAAKQATQQRATVLPGAGGPPSPASALRQPCLAGIPQFLRNDPELRYLSRDVLRHGPGNSTVAAGPGYLNPLVPVPRPGADVLPVPKHRMDRRVAPPPPKLVALAVIVGRGDALIVQL